MFGRSDVVRHGPPHGGAHSALQRTESSLARKVLLGLLAISPALVMVVTLAAAIAPSEIGDLIPGPILEFLTASGWWGAGVVGWAVTITFAIIVLKSERIIVEKIIWCVGFLMFPMISVPAYWYIAVFREKTLAEILPLGELGHAPSSDQNGNKR